MIIQTVRADLNGDGVLDTVSLTGDKEEAGSAFIRNIALIIRDGRTQRTETIALVNNAGYNPRLFIGDFNRDRLDDVLVSIDSGGSGGFGFYYLYSFAGGRARLLFDNDMYNREIKYDVIFKNGCKVEVYNYQLKKTYTIDVRAKQKDVYAQIFDRNCRLLQPTSGFVPGLNNLYPLAREAEGGYNLLAFERVIGLYGADTLGNLETVLVWNGAGFVQSTESLRLS